MKIKPEASDLIRTLSGDYADRYVGERLLPDLGRLYDLGQASVSDIKAHLYEPEGSLQVLFGIYGFARRGKDRAELSSIASTALERLLADDGIQALLEASNGSTLWETYCFLCEERGRSPLPQQNRGVVAGLTELAQEIYRLDGRGSITRWVVESVLQTDRIETPFLRMVDVRGIGPKMVSLFLRDIIFLFDLEPTLDLADRIYVQPVDRWVRLAAPILLEDADAASYPDSTLAGKYAKAARQADVSGIRLNMGLSHFGGQLAAPASALPRKLLELGTVHSQGSDNVEQRV